MSLIDNEKIAWYYFIAQIGNPFGVAGLMGNLKAESGFNPKNLNNAANKKLGVTDDEYTNAVDSGVYTNFIGDGYDYGIAQWVYSTRKRGLIDLAKKRGVSIGDLNLQLDYVWKELQAYSAVLKTLKNAKSIKEASDDVLLRYEKPANQGESAKQKRLKFAEEIYNKYAMQNIIDNQEEVVIIPKKIKVIGSKVNIRSGDSIQYRVVETADKNTEFAVCAISADTDWYAIRVDDNILWISQKYVKPIE